MPYEWLPPCPDTPERLRLWPHRSLPRRGFVWFIAITSALASLSLWPHLGTARLWVLLPFLLAVLVAIWVALERSYRDGEIVEELSLSRDRITLTRLGPRGRRQDWQANPYWVQLRLYPTEGPVPQYLTLKAEGREVELGAFLSEGERIALDIDLRKRLNDLR